MTKNEMKYSVLMSVYYKERPEWLDFSINSMLEQTIFPSEFVLIKDGKLTEELEEVINKYTNIYPQIFNVIALPQNVGLGPALSIGINNCKYEYIARMDSDDYSVFNRVEREFEVFEVNPELGMVGSNVSEFIDSIDNVICDVILPESNEDIIKYSKKRNPFRHPSILFKKEAVLKAGNYREYYLCEDYDMWTRMIRSGCKCYNIQEVLVYMRISDDFYKRRGGLEYLKSIRKFKKEQVYNKYFTKTQYYKSMIPHSIVCLLPNSVRDFVYRSLLRKKKKEE